MRRSYLAALAAVVGVAAGCGQDTVSPEVLTGTAVITYRDPAVDFGAYSTYAITSKLTIFEEVNGEPRYTFASAPEILAAIQVNMADRGFVLVAVVDPELPPSVPPDADLAVNPVVLRGTQFAYYPCDWWDWWGYPGYGCDLAWGWVPYRVGTLIVPLADLRNPPPEPGTWSLVWTGAGYSVLTPATEANVQIAIDAVNQAFAQSPYLKTP